MLKKVFVVLVAVIGFGLSALSQNVVIQTNEIDKSKTQDDCAYRINGICTTEDVGGVDISIRNIMPPHTSYQYTVTFENYNDFTASVIYKIREKIGVMVLRPNEKKEVTDEYRNQRPDVPNVVLIVRKVK